jgi:DNA polymerase-3 subunit alpha
MRARSSASRTRWSRSRSARKLVEKYPAILIAGKLEGHAQHTGKHAAGVMVTKHPVTNTARIDNSGAAQIDKKDAESAQPAQDRRARAPVLSVIQDCLDQIGKDRDWLVNYPLDDTEAFEILNAERYSGIFQFEGYALQSLCRQMKVRTFDDLQVIGALARPGPLHCGAATSSSSGASARPSRTCTRWRARHARHLRHRDLSGAGDGHRARDRQDVVGGRVRAAQGDVEVAGRGVLQPYWEKFEAGAAEHGIASRRGARIWDKMCTFGSWAFNKSHSVSYGIISYWCCVLKAHYPLEFAAACLRNEKDTEQGIRILRDLERRASSTSRSTRRRPGSLGVVDGVLVGGLTNIKGIGREEGAGHYHRRRTGARSCPGQRKLLSEPRTPYDDIFEGDRRFGDIFIATPRQRRDVRTCHAVIRHRRCGRLCVHREAEGEESSRPERIRQPW